MYSNKYPCLSGEQPVDVHYADTPLGNPPHNGNLKAHPLPRSLACQGMLPTISQLPN